MKTEDLIEALAREPQPAPRAALAARITIALAAGGFAALLLVAVTMGVRPDIGISWIAVAAKAAFSALVATFALGAAAQAARPGAGGSRALALAVVALAAVVVGAASLLGVAPHQRAWALFGGGIPWCVVLIPIFGLPTSAALVWALREAAPTRLALAGSLAGALAGGVGAVAYAMHCPVDSVAFVSIWYVAGIAVSSGLGALLGSRLLRW